MPGKARRRSPERDGQAARVGALEGVSMVALLRSECSKATMLQSRTPAMLSDLSCIGLVTTVEVVE